MSRGAIMVMAGGTGGHVFPALAVAERLRAEGWPVFWLGTQGGLEARVVPARGFEVEWVNITGLRGKGLATMLGAPFRLLSAVWQSLGIIRRRRPVAVLGMGGYVSGPGGLAAWLMRRPLVVHEQNAVAGLTNRILSCFAKRVLTGFPGVLRKGEWIGNPVREDIAALPGPRERMQGRSGRMRLLVLGGSQGARAINQVITKTFALLPEERRPEIVHQCGEQLLQEARAAWAEEGIAVEPLPFIDDMRAAYAWADLVLCRAGALTIAELASAGVGSLLVPFPAAVDDHQTKNANFLVDAGAAELLPQSSLDASRLAARLEALASDRVAVLRMAEAAHSLARNAATMDLTSVCVAVAAEGA